MLIVLPSFVLSIWLLMVAKSIFYLYNVGNMCYISSSPQHADPKNLRVPLQGSSTEDESGPKIRHDMIEMKGLDGKQEPNIADHLTRSEISVVG